MADVSNLADANTNPAGSFVTLSPTARMTSDQQSGDTRLRLLSATIDLQTQLDNCNDLVDAGQWIADRIRDSLQCKRVLLAWRRGQNAPCRLIADTSSDSSDADAARFAQAAAEEVIARSCITAWPSVGEKHRHAMLAVAQFAGAASLSQITAVPLSDTTGRIYGALLVADATDQAYAEQLLDIISLPTTSKLASLQRREPNRLERYAKAVSANLSLRKRKTIIWGLGIVSLLMLIPMRYHVRAECELQPVQRRFVAAPIDGPLSNVAVRPGDTVAEGDLLATINPREIEYELAGVRAEWNRADQQKRGLIAQHDFAASKIAALETERWKLQTSLLEYQRDNLEIRSPIAGMVVAGDLKHSEGTPVTKGQTLFEVAPLGQTVVEVAIAEHEFASVRSGMSVTFELYALPGQTRNGVLRSVHPSAELRDQENVFIGEVVIDDPEGILRPGMRGRCWIAGDRHPWGWNLFHRAYDATRLAMRSTLAW
jgi:multidrug efflux pump subunit AcrA (membrane-fusion protein)